MASDSRTSSAPPSSAQCSSPAPSAPPKTGGSSLPPPLPEEDDQRFFAALSEGGIIEELSDPLRHVLSEQAGVGDEEKRRLDLLELYYAASGDDEASSRRRAKDRFFAHHDDRPTSAKRLVGELAALLPELEGVHLARIGGDDGPLVLRCGEQFAAVADDTELDADGEAPEVTVRGLVRAMNVLLDRAGVRERLVALPGDGDREFYVGLSLTAAMTLCREGLLDAEDAEELMDDAAW